MNKFEQLKKEYDLLQASCADFLDPACPDELEFYVELAALRIWSGNGRYSEDYAKAVQAISGKSRTPAQISRAMLDSTEPAEMAKIPAFFARMVASDFENGSHRTKDFIGDLKSLLAGAAFINGDFTIEESNMLSAEVKKLMTYAISQGVKVDYATGRIRTRTTPLKEDSYLDPEHQARISADLIFDALDRDFLRAGGGRRRNGQPGGAYGMPGQNGADGPAAMGSIFDVDSNQAGGPGNDSRDGSDTSGPGSTGSGDGPAFAPEEGGTAATADPSLITSSAQAMEDPRTMEELLAELDELVGLTDIKEDIRSLMNFITITRLRKERGLTVPAISYHLVFTGNPGTGKTTVARLVAGLYHRIGILPRGQLVEADRSQLVAGYTGQTAIKTMDVIGKAMGGVLFIDEAYALVNDDQDSFGKEAIETILKAMEDHRDELVVIVAGYTDLMHKFIESNPGFRSRFSKYFEFPDYTGQELLEIFRSFCRKNGYHMTEEAEAWLLIQFNEMYAHRDSHFGNGRTARNVFEKAIHQQANRLAGLSPGAAGTGAAAESKEVKNGAGGTGAESAEAKDGTGGIGAESAEAEDGAGEIGTESAEAKDGAGGTDPAPDAADAGAGKTGGGPVPDPDAAPILTDGQLTDEQLQELTREDLEAAVEAERRKSDLPD